MKNHSSVQFLLQGVCLLTFLQVIASETKCNTPKLGPNDKTILTIFDSQDKINRKMWDDLCNAVKQFPQGLITLDYRPGAAATGSAANIQCGGGTCNEDIYNECELLNSENYNDCFKDTIDDYIKMVQCYCKKDVTKILLENAAYRASLKVPESAIPTVIVNKVYDPCSKFGSYEEILTYLCQVYQKKVGKCG